MHADAGKKLQNVGMKQSRFLKQGGELLCQPSLHSDSITLALFTDPFRKPHHLVWDMSQKLHLFAQMSGQIQGVLLPAMLFTVNSSRDRLLNDHAASLHDSGHC